MTFAFPPGDAFTGGVGIVPPTLSKEDGADWLGRQGQCAALWFSGECFVNGSRVADVATVDVSHGAEITLFHDTVKRTLTISQGRSCQVIKVFLAIPAGWRFAVGGFGGKVAVRSKLPFDGTSATPTEKTIAADPDDPPPSLNPLADPLAKGLWANHTEPLPLSVGPMEAIGVA